MPIEDDGMMLPALRRQRGIIAAGQKLLAPEGLHELQRGIQHTVAHDAPDSQIRLHETGVVVRAVRSVA